MHVFIYNMAGVWCFTQFLLLWFAALSPAAESEFIQVPEDNRPAGIFLLIEEGNYTLNFTAAKDACQSLGSTIATREQVQQALNQGLETCKYGWIAEAVAVVPRLKPDKKCGADKTGVVTWSARLDTEFGVFCFDASALSPAAESKFIQVPEDNRPAGVFLLIEEGNYTLNFTAAKDACQSLDSTIATGEQVQQALNQGLETCKYGWIAEAVAVVPRLKPENMCGAGKTGVVTWFTSLDTEFGVFCFDASDSQKTLHTLTAAPPTPATVMTTTPANSTREQMQQALNQGLETCKFGWTAEQVAVIPRLTSDIKCGQGKTGLVPWRAIPGREFGVFCFNASDSQETAAAHTLTSSPPAPTPLSQTSVATTALITSSPSSATTASAAASPRPTSAEPTERTTASPPDSTVLVQTTHSTTTTSSYMKTSSTRRHTSPEYIRQPTESVSAASSTSVSELQLHGKSSRSPLGALSTTLIVLGVVLLLLAAAAGAVWYYGLTGQYLL
ncbi:hypothetical protein INR49_028107 [Caranx melampygus]|nr:hypothetical protein INR49_028107 [Caranx melampygus]